MPPMLIDPLDALTSLAVELGLVPRPLRQLMAIMTIDGYHAGLGYVTAYLARESTEGRVDVVPRGDRALATVDKIRERVDDETWGLIVDFEWGSAREVVTGIEIGLELGYDHGRMSALVEAQAEDVPGKAATALVARLADLGDTEVGNYNVLLALIATLRATVMAARGE